MGGRFNALASCLLRLKAEVMEILLYGCVTWSLSAKHFSSLRTVHQVLLRVIRFQGRERTDYTSLSYAKAHADFQAKRGGRHIIQLRAEPFEACPHEPDPSFDFEREVSASWITPPRYKNWAVCPYLWSASSITSGGARDISTV